MVASMPATVPDTGQIIWVKWLRDYLNQTSTTLLTNDKLSSEKGIDVIHEGCPSPSLFALHADHVVPLGRDGVVVPFRM